MFIGIAYLALFLAAGLLLAQWAVPDGSPAVTVPLGCGFGVSLLAALPAGFALVCGFTLRAVWLAAAGAALLCAVLIFAGRGHIRFASDPDRGAMWLCLLPVLAVTLYLLHTHVLHGVNGTLHTGQSCYGDMPMHLGFIEYIAQSGQFPPRYPLLAGSHRFGYPFLCETVSSVFRLLARRMLGSAVKACLAFYLFFMGSGFGFVYFLKDAATFKGIFTGFYTTPTNYTTKNIVWVNPIVDLLIPQRATLFGWCVLFAALYLLWRFAFESESHLWLPLAVLVLPLPLLQTHSALALVLLCLAGGLYTLARRPHTAKILLPWLGLAAVCGVCWPAEMSGTVLAQSLDGTNMLRLHFNWVNGNSDGTLKDPWLWFYVKNIGLVPAPASAGCLAAVRRFGCWRSLWCSSPTTTIITSCCLLPTPLAVCWQRNCWRIGPNGCAPLPCGRRWSRFAVLWACSAAC